MRFGIDLGTTYSSIGYYDPDRHEVVIAELIDSADGQKMLPSAVFVESSENVITGISAIRAGYDRPDRCFRWFKRDLGVSQGSMVDGKQWTPAECSKEILKTLKREAGLYLSSEVKDVVITFPAWFEPHQKDLTREAAVGAGLNVIRMMDEPCAAALAYVVESLIRKAREASSEKVDLNKLMPQIVEEMAGKDRAILVYDLGGGTFDVAMVQAEAVTNENVTKLRFKVLCHDGDITLGGKDWDTEIKNIIAEEDQSKNDGHNPMDDAGAGRLDDDAELTKRDLARLESRKYICTKGHQIEISRAVVNDRTAPLLQRTLEITAKVIAKAIEEGVNKDKITVLLCGGMTKWPHVREKLTEVLGREPLRYGNPDLLVALGGAYLAYLTEVVEETENGKPSESSKQDGIKIPGVDGLIVLDNKPVEIPYPAIGIEVVDAEDPVFRVAPEKARRFVKKVIPSQATAGDFYQENFETASDKQDKVELTVYFLKEREGHKDDETDLAAWHKYKSFTLTGLPAEPAGYKIHVRLKYVEGGVIDGTGWDASGKEVIINGKTLDFKM